jgi:hypothetical protein
VRLERIDDELNMLVEVDAEKLDPGCNLAPVDFGGKGFVFEFLANTPGL